jgi:hypothetical protein
MSRVVSVISADTALAATAGVDYTYLCTAALTATLPAPADNTNRYTIKRTGTGDVTLATSGGTIDGAANFILDVQWQSVDLVGDGTNWVII